MNLTLSEFQDAFVSALQGCPAPGLAALTRQPAFAVYRNTVMAGCVEALCANFPSVLTLVGREWMEAVAAAYARQAPPDDPRLIYYGTAFADFLEQAQAQHGVPYLAAVARLDACWNAAFSAVDAPCLDLAELAGMTAGDLARSVLSPRDNARWHWCAEHPAYRLWRCGREQLEWTDDQPWGGEGVLFVGSPEGVSHQPLEQGGCAFLQACAAGQTLEQASSFAQHTQPDLDFSDLLGRLISAQVFCPLSFP
ncbi:DNA-binding domain-containing protein [Pseudomonas sp.]|uniref:HvfC/BufC N-terminal domain-containing protein n=1 Tax=Pseudomonas sp. TaxID=306 RepID=UPI0028B04F53|nr:DNA-binding domain-containing protein [Pseudomonas sp.]